MKDIGWGIVPGGDEPRGSWAAQRLLQAVRKEEIPATDSGSVQQSSRIGASQTRFFRTGHTALRELQGVGFQSVPRKGSSSYLWLTAAGLPMLPRILRHWRC